MLRQAWGILGPLFALVLVFGLAYPEPADAQEEDRSGDPDYLVVLKIVVPDGSDLRATVKEGGMFRIKVEGVGTYGLSPRVQNAARKAVDLGVYEITDIASGTPIRRLEVLRFRGQKRLHLRGHPNFTIQIEHIVPLRSPEANAASPASLMMASAVGFFSPGDFMSGILPKMRCCVTCGRVTACGCAVEMDCGSCCSGICCIHSESMSGSLT